MSSSTFNSTNFEQQSQQARWRALIPPARRKCRLQTSHTPARIGSQRIALMTLACRRRRCRFRRVTQLLRLHHSDARPLARFVQKSVQYIRVFKSLLQCCTFTLFRGFLSLFCKHYSRIIVRLSSPLSLLSVCLRHSAIHSLLPGAVSQVSNRDRDYRDRKR